MANKDPVSFGNCPLTEISTRDLRKVRAKIRKCAKAGVFLPGSDPKGFIKIIDEELNERKGWNTGQTL